MGHNLEQLGSAALDTMSGLITFAAPQDLPEGASPRNYDVDFIVGSVFTRPGLAPVYVYTNTLLITELVVYAGIGVFTYSGVNPVPNEDFTLSNFTGTTLFLNGLMITVLTVNPVTHTFTAALSTGAATYSDLTGTAISNVGNFIGPNPPTVAVSVATSGGNAWQNPENVLGDIAYASVNAGTEIGTGAIVATSASNVSSGATPWINPSNINSNSAVASATLSAATSENLLALGYDFNLPPDSTVDGITISISGESSVYGVGSVNVQLATNTGSPLGTPVNQPLPAGYTTFSLGSSSYQWGTTITPATVNGGKLGILVNAAVTRGTATIDANALTVTVFYTLAGSTQQLKTTVYNFAIPATSGISGIGVSFQAYTSNAGTLTFQLLKDGVLVGTTHTQVLTTTPTIYTVGADNDMWNTTWLYSDLNNTGFGVVVTAAGTGTSFINDIDAIAYVTPALVNFNYIKSYIQNNDHIYTLALDASGIIWEEDVTDAPGVLYISLAGIIPGSFAQSATTDDREYICFSNLAVGTDRPRVYNGSGYYPLSQVGPGAPPSANASQGSATTNVLYILTYTVAAGVITWTYNPATFTATVGNIYVIQGIPLSQPENVYLNGRSVVVTGTPAAGTFTSDAPPNTPDGSGTSTGGLPLQNGLLNGGATLTIAQGYIIANILESDPQGIGNATGTVGQNGATPFNGQEALLSSGPSSTSPGNVITYWYGPGPEDPTLLAAFKTGLPVYVYLDAATPFYPSQTVAVINHGVQVPPDQGGVGPIPYFTVAWTGAASSQGYLSPENVSWAVGPGNDGNFQITMATLVLSAPAPLNPGDSVTITGAVPAGWNGIWKITQAVNSGTLNILTESSTGNGTISYSYTSATVPAVTVVDGDTIAITGSTGPSFTNGTFVVSAVTAGSFTVSNPAATAAFSSSEPVGVPAVGTLFGTNFVFDPGANAAGLGQDVPNPIIGPPIGADYTLNSGTLAVAGSPFTGVGAGTRQVVCFFITESNYYTATSPAVTFNIAGNSTYVAMTHIPIGPPNVIARVLAFTEAGQNGIPGANFYFIPQEVTQTVNGATTVLANSTVINDNVTNSVNLIFTDSVLLDSEEIDIQGNDLFNLIELGSSAWVVPYASRNFYGMQLNKVTNFINLSFDGGYLSNNPNGAPSYSVAIIGGPYGNLQPLGWSVLNTAQQSLLISPVTGDALYIKNVSGVFTPGSATGMIYQSAYEDSFSVPIIEINTTYSVRVAASIPSGIQGAGVLIIDLVDYTLGAFGQVYGSFMVPLTEMTTDTMVFTGNLLITTFPIVSTIAGSVDGSNVTGVSPKLQLRVWAQSLAVGSDILIDRIEVFPTLTPYLLAQVYGSYVNDPEAIDGSDNGGIIDTTTENAQTVYGAFVMHDLMYLLKQSSMYSTEQNPNSEPGGWGIKEVSNRVGACGINAYDTGEEWAMMACRGGIFGFNGGQPVKLSLEIFNLWDLINWNAANTIVLRNDINNKRFYCWIPLPTGTSPTGVPTSTVQWLPNAPYNPTPTTPNVCLMCNYQGLDTAAELFAGPGVHTTMFGALAAVDMKRKWTIWQIPSPYAAFIYRQDGTDAPLFICNGIGSSKIYQLLTSQLSDDGVAINSLYTTYGHVNAVKAATQPIFGMHTKRYTVLQGTVEGAGVLGVRILPNVINPKYPYAVPVGIKLVSPAYDDFFRPINVKAQRAFLEFSTNAVDAWFHLDKTLLTGKADPWSSLNATGGMNNGIA